MVICLKTQLEEAKKNEEAQKIQLTKREESCHMLELEIINVKKINESTNATLMTQIEEAKKNEEAHKIQLTKKEESCHRLELEAINLKRIQIENKEEIKRLKNEVVDLTKYIEELKTYEKTNNCTEVLDDTEEMVINLKTQLEGAKEKEEALKIQLTKKEETCHMLEMEVINLKKKNEKTKETVKFQNNSTILDRIWNSQRPTDDKTGLGYNKKEEGGKWSTIQKHDKGSYSSKEKGTVTNLKQTMNFVKEGSYKSKKQETYQKTDFSCHNRLKYGNTFNGYCFSCNNFGHKALECKSPEKKNSGRSNNLMRCWRCNYVGHTTKFCHTMRCYKCDWFGHKSQNCRKSRSQSMRNNSYKSGRKSNEGWKKRRNDKSQRTNLEKKYPTNKISHEKVWRRKSEIESKKDDLASENEEIDNKKMMGEVPNKECEIHRFEYEMDQTQERRVPKEEDDTIADPDDIMQIKSTLTNKRKMQTKNPKEENEEVSLTQNNDDNDESSIAYQPEELSNENLGSFPMLFS
jgi:hypothetical protein